MPRTRAFSEAAVLTGAMMAFREHGFGGVSVRDLERATGISAGSLYNAYADKEGLYRAAFEHYFRMIIEPRLSSASSIDDLERLFLGLFELPMADGHGCLVTNAAVEFGAGRSVASDFIARGLDALEASIRAVLRGEIGAEAAGPATLRLVVFYQGILVLSRAGRTIRALRPVIRAEFEQLRAMKRRKGNSS